LSTAAAKNMPQMFAIYDLIPYE